MVTVVEFKNRLNTEQSFKDKVAEQVILVIDRLRTEQRAILFAKLFIGYIKEMYDWETLCYFSECLDSIQPIDIDILRELFNEASNEIENITVNTFDKYMLLASIERLKSYGMVGIEDLTWQSSIDQFKKKAYISSLGEIFHSAISV